MSVVWVTFATFHLEMSALKAAAAANTTHHPKRRKQWTQKRWRQERMQNTTNSRGGELKINQINKSVTPSIEQTVVETEVDVLEFMDVTCPVSHLEMSALKARA